MIIFFWDCTLHMVLPYSCQLELSILVSASGPGSFLQATPNVHLLKLNMLPTGMAWAGQRKEGSSSDEKKWGVKNLWRTIISSVGVFGLGPPQSFLPIGKWKIINVTNNQSRIGSLHDKTFDLMQWNRSIEKKKQMYSSDCLKWWQTRCARPRSIQCLWLVSVCQQNYYELLKNIINIIFLDLK